MKEAYTIERLYEMQKALDARIIKEKGLEGKDLLSNTVLALQVEIGELANEWRGFKHWSNDREPRTKKVHSTSDGFYLETNPLLEEYVDCLHFFLSIARQLGLREDELDFPTDRELKGDTARTFTEILYHIPAISLRNDPWTKRSAWLAGFAIFFALGEQRLGFTWGQIATAYIAKNKTNHDRQTNGY